MITKSSINSRLNLFNPLAADRPGLPLLVYFPGMDGTGALFSDRAKELAPFFNIRCLTIPANDLRDWQELTKDTVNCLLAELVTAEQNQIYLCGESFGGCLAMSVAVTIPQFVLGQILVNSASCFNQRPLLGLGINLIPLLPSWVHGNSAVGMLPFLAELNRMSAESRRALLAAMKSLPQKVVSWRLTMLRDFSLDPELCREFEQPTILIAGKRDRLLPSFKEAEKLGNLFPNSTVEVLPHSGHACLLETEVDLADIVLKHGLVDDC